MTPTASRLGLLERCPSAGALSSVWAESTDDQRAGTERHRFLQRAHEIGTDEALAAIPEDAPWRAQCEALVPLLGEIPAGEHELAYAFDTDSGEARLLGAWLDRAYEVSPSEISGTADLVCAPTPERPRWLVVDFKGDEEVDPAAENLQLGFYALCVARVHGLDEIDVAIGYLRHGGGIWWDRATLDAFALSAVADRARRVARAVLAARASAAPLDFATGYHCRRCPALPLCPAQTASALALIGEAPTPETLAQLTDEAAGRAWEQVKVATEWLDRVRAALSARAEIRGLPLPGGARLVPCEVETRRVVLDRALPLLRERFGEQVDPLVKRTLSAESVGLLARQLAPGKGQKKAVDALWSELAAAGAVKTSNFVQLRVRAPSRKD